MLKVWTVTKRILVSILPSVVAVALAFGVGALLLLVAGKHPGEAFSTLFMGALGSPNRIAETLVRAVPLMILALGISIAFKSQIWNIGGDGQFMMGATCAVFVGLNLNLAPVLLWPVTFLAAFLGGGLWGGLAGLMRAKFNANEVITTLMLNYIAMHLLSWLIRGPMMDPNGQGFPQTALLAQPLQLPILFGGTRLHFGLIIGLLIMAAGYFFWRTTVGLKIELVGESEHVARYCGIQVPRTIILTMFISAGLAGIAGWNEVFGVQYRLLDDISSGFGNLAIVVALLGNLHPLGIVISAFFFAALMVGGNTMQLMVGIPFSLVTVIQGLVIIFVISRVVYTQWRDGLAIRRFNSRVSGQSSGRSH
ncbi:ABC transporter permease [Desulfosporosinus nitroreducens]|uniref:ABC transporter permease n=1 Tax=Desulfosporosinus nitroreducens TaxID=2018668 RepID=UPI00207D0502|nr:ABC transporter permease [Desulfosporosinus nitroreducens]MCO1600817.1 ABC transporter permease [Desulfosporosinus nitroreducens]